jgi:serine protease Do
MKTKITLSIMGWIFASLFGQNTYAQTEKIEKVEIITKDGPASKNLKETQEIIIRKKGDKDTKIILDINGGKIMINGKPMAEFNEDGITINNRKMIIRDGNKITMDFKGDMLGDLDDLDKLDGLSEITIDKFDDNNMMFGNGEISKSFLGVGTEKNKEGSKILTVEKDSPAEKAGLLKDDIIYKVDDKKVDGNTALSDIISAIKIGEKAKLYFLRDGKKKEVDVTIGERKNRFILKHNYSYNLPNGKVRSFVMPLEKIEKFRNTFPREFKLKGDFNLDNNGIFIDARKQKLGIKIQDTEDGNGVKILEIEEASPSAKAGLQKNDIVTEIAGAKVNNTDEAREQLRENAAKNNYNIKAKREGKEMDFIINIPKKLKTANL